MMPTVSRPSRTEAMIASWPGRNSSRPNTCLRMRLAWVGVGFARRVTGAGDIARCTARFHPPGASPHPGGTACALDSRGAALPVAHGGYMYHHVKKLMY